MHARPANNLVVIDLNRAKVDFVVDFNIQAAADCRAEIRVREREGRRVGDKRRASSGRTGERVVFEVPYGNSGERVGERPKARLRNVIFDLHAA